MYANTLATVHKNMTRSELVELRDSWNKRAYDLQADLGGRTHRARLIKGQQRARVQVQAGTLSACAAELGRILDAEPHS